MVYQKKKVKNDSIRIENKTELDEYGNEVTFAEELSDGGERNEMAEWQIKNDK